MVIQSICFIDDDDDNRMHYLEWANYHGYQGRAYETAFEANGYAADCYVTDVSAVSPMQVGHHAYAPICKLMENHPGARIIIGSCASRNCVEEILDDIEQMSGIRPLFFDASRGFEGLEEVMYALGGGAECAQ